MTAALQIAVYVAGALLNALLAYEAVSEKQKWWKIAIPAVTALGLLALAIYRSGLLDLQSI